MLRILIISAIAALSGAAGQIVMRKGMMAVGPLENYEPLAMIEFLWRALCNPWVGAGTVLSGILYFCLLTALSWTDVTVAFPLTAIEYVVAALLAVYFLQESIPLTRWAGILLVVAGVVLISVSEQSKPKQVQAANTSEPLQASSTR